MTLLDPLQEDGAVAAAAVTVLEQLVVHAKHLLGNRLKTLPPLPQSVEGLGKHRQKSKGSKRKNTTFWPQRNEEPSTVLGSPGVSTDTCCSMPSLMGALIVDGG